MSEATHASQELKQDYGYLWWTNSTGAWKGVPSDAYASMGKFGNSMLMVPSLDLIVLRQIGDDSGHERDVKLEELFALATAAVTDASPSLAVQDTPSDLEVAKTFANFRINRPILLTHAGDGSNRVFIPSQLGTIYVLPNDPSVEDPQVFMDISDRVVYEDKQNEKGFLGMAFHPKFIRPPPGLTGTLRSTHSTSAGRAPDPERGQLVAGQGSLPDRRRGRFSGRRFRS